MSKSKKQVCWMTVFVCLLLLGAASLQAQAGGDRVAVAFSDPSQPGTVKVGLLSGSITVKAYEGKEVVVEARARTGRESGRDSSDAGMKRIPLTSTGLSVEEESNRVQVSAASHLRPIDLTITVPVHTSLNLRTVNDGNIVVTGADGDIDVNNVNGTVTLNNVSGSVVAHALNGKLLATISRVNPQKPMAFSSLNGDIDVTFPADLKANLLFGSDRGEVYSDFDVQLQAQAPQQVVEDTRTQGGKYRVKVEKTVRGTINGGGQEIQFKNFNGNIYIRKAGK